jgi:thioredoxin 1
MASSRVRPVNDIDFESQVLEAPGAVLVEFTATWCGPCKLQATILEKVFGTETRVSIAAVDVDESPELAARYAIRGMPTLVLFEGGREKTRRLGLTREAELREMFGG